MKFGFLRKKLFRFLFLFFLLIVSLEFLARVCPARHSPSLFESCRRLVTVYGDMKEVKRDVTEERELSFEEIVEKRVLFVPREDISGVNGVACWDVNVLVDDNDYIGSIVHTYALIADDLPQNAKEYVVAHEAIHIGGVSSEIKANYLAALKHPIGLVETVWLSVKNVADFPELEEIPCRVGGFWRLFKLYFLGIDSF